MIDLLPRLHLPKPLLIALVGVFDGGAVFAATLVDDSFTAMAVSSGLIVASDGDSDLYTSSDGGETFTFRASARTLVSDASADFGAIGAVGDTVVTAGVDGLVLRSPDGGLNWEQAAAPTILGSLYDVAGRTDGANPNIWIAVGDDGSDSAIFRSTDDGVNWSSFSGPANVIFRSIVWSGSRWIACGSNDFFEGVVYTSNNGVFWSASAVPTASPLLDIEVDFLGNVVAVGESGQILRSVDDGLSFVELLPNFIGGVDLNAIAVNGSGTFTVGGGESLIFEIVGSIATEIIPATAGASSVNDIVVISDEALVAGPTVSDAVRTKQFSLTIASGGSLDLVLIVGGTLSGKLYFIQNTSDLTTDDWSTVSGLQAVSSGADLTFDVAIDGNSVFWRAVEF